jgi:hypothetical protein
MMNRAQLIPKTVNCWSYSAWIKVTLYYPPVDKHGIEPAKHPAVIEDNWLALSGPTVSEQDKRGGWKHGQIKDSIINYLRLNGPSKITEIAEDIQMKSGQISQVIARNPLSFKLVGYETCRAGRGVSRAAVWGLIEKGV